MNDVARQEVLAIKDDLLLTLSYPSDKAFAILKDGKSSEAQRLIDAARVCAAPPPPAKGKSPAECLSEVLGGSKSDYPIHWSERRKRAAEIVDRFFSHLETKGVKLTGDRVTDQPVIEKEWGEYKKAHESEPGIADAEEALDRWFNVAAFYETTSLKIHLKMARDITGFVMVGLLLGIPVLRLMPELKTDNGVLLALTPTWMMDLESLNKDLDGPIDFKGPLLGILGQIYYNPFLDSWIQSFPPDERPLAQNVLSLVTLIGVFGNHQYQNSLLEVTWAEQYQPDIKSMVGQLMRYMFIHGDMGLVPFLHRVSPEINREARGEVNLLSGAMRGAIATMFFLNARTNARIYAQAAAQKSIIPSPDVESDTNQNQVFSTTVYALSDNDTAKSYPMMMNDSLFLADLLMQSVDEVLEGGRLGKSPTQYIAPPMAAGLVTLLLYFTISRDIQNNPQLGGADSARDFVERYRLNRTVEEVEGTVSGAATDTAMAFLFGGLEALAAGYSKNRKAVVGAFAMVNNMLGTNLTMARVAAEGKKSFEESGQSEASPYFTVTKTMGTIPLIDIVASLWAGIDAGSTAALPTLREKWYKDWQSYPDFLPALLGLSIRLAYLNKAYDIKKGAGPNKDIENAGRDAAITQQWISFGAYASVTAISFVLSRWLGEKIDLEFKYERGSYQIAGRVFPFAAGVGVAGTFGEKAGPNERERRLARLEQNRKILAELAERSGALRKELERPDLDPATSTRLAGDSNALTGSILATQRDIVVGIEQETGDQVAVLDEVLRQGTVPFDPANKDQRLMLTGQFLPGLKARGEQLRRRIAQIEANQTRFEPTGIGPGSLTSFRIVSNPPTEAGAREIASLRDELGKIEGRVKRIEKGDMALLAEMYRERTRVDLRIAGFNSVLRQYRNSLVRQKDELVVAARLLAEMAKG